ncbi:MAG TPA: FtsW/RodA/SpoVE family cell cycle protein [Bryobacteraceae bacterium]|nr:FtsW/RodA/SpoVE family cell cycle protein [Bryobacteraceae bacterium]
MAVTRSWEQRVIVQAGSWQRTAPPERRRELPWLVCASVLVSAGLAFVLLAKTSNFSELQAKLDHNELLNLNTVTQPEELLPFLEIFPDAGERELAAGKIAAYVQSHKPLPNVGALARLRVSRSEIESDPRWQTLHELLRRQIANQQGKPRKGEIRVALLPVAKLKPVLVVRTPREFLLRFAGWIALYLSSFYIVHFIWRRKGFRGDPAFLPALLLLTGLGLILAVSLRDPLRDTLEFGKFAWGVALGCAILLLPLVRYFDYRRFARWTYTPLFASLGLFVLLLVFGSGPTGNDSKVNLGPFQPVEIIKLLLVFFMAGYFTRNWERLRELREKRLVPRWLRWIELPRFSHALPVMCGVACALGMFFISKDLGPALVTGFLFLAMFGVARGRAGLAVMGLAILIAGVTIGYRLGEPPTVVARVSMWLSPWDNDVSGGDQLAQSIWAFSTGGLWGSGPGRGDPSLIPAGHTDLVLPAIGEEWGFAGVAVIGLLFAWLVRRSFRIARDAQDEYAVFLSVGLASLFALEMLLISGGVLGVIPLTGVVSPFLSFGNTAMLANFLLFALILSISNHDPRPEIGDPFVRPIARLSAVLGACALVLLGRAAYFQVARDQEFLARDVKVFESDGVKRAQHNPRLTSLAREIPRGNIYDRNGVLLATSNWNDLERDRAQYEKLGVSMDRVCSRLESRHYPFGELAAHFLGDWRTGENFHATNASLVEHDSNTKLAGYRDYAELAPLVRYRHHPGNTAIQQLRARDRNVRTSIDIRLQMKATEILERRLRAARRDKGAVVVMDAQSGDVLSLVSFPAPSGGTPATPEELLDRARYGQYPPGSTFKLVTAIAALRADAHAAARTFQCRSFGGRGGVQIPGWRRIIRDDVGDAAHGTLDMRQAITVSCNAYFAQLGVNVVGPDRLRDTLHVLQLPDADPAALKATMPFASYGQGPILVTPFRMARVAAAIANGGAVPQGRWILDDTGARTEPPRAVVAPDIAAFLADAMRSVVTNGTARRAMKGARVTIAGKTGTAQLDQGAPHSWFAGFAPADGSSLRRIAFAVMVEHGGYGGSLAAPIAREIAEAAADLGLIPAIAAITVPDAQQRK